MAEGATLEELVQQEEAAGAEQPDAAEAGTPPATEPEAAETETEATDTGEADSDEQPDGGDEASEEEAGGQDQDEFREELDRLTGYKFSKKYQNKEEAGRGIAELVEMAGQKNVDAEEARQLRKLYGPEEYQQLLAGPEKPAERGAQPSRGTLPASFDEYEMLMAALAPESQADERTQKRAAEVSRDFGRRLFELTTNPENVLGASEALAAFSERLEKLESGVTETTQHQAVSNWLQQHGTEMYAADRSYTPLGQRVKELYENDPDCETQSDDVDSRIRSLNIALRLAKAEQLRPKPTRKVAKSAKHQAGVAPGTEKLAPTDERMEQMMKEGMSDEDILKSFAV